MAALPVTDGRARTRWLCIVPSSRRELNWRRNLKGHRVGICFLHLPHNDRRQQRARRLILLRFPDCGGQQLWHIKFNALSHWRFPNLTQTNDSHLGQSCQRCQRGNNQKKRGGHRERTMYFRSPTHTCGRDKRMVSSCIVDRCIQHNMFTKLALLNKGKRGVWVYLHLKTVLKGSFFFFFLRSLCFPYFTYRMRKMKCHEKR